MTTDFFCGLCGKPTDGHLVSFGIGPFECRGRPGVDRRNSFVSKCCDYTLYTDEGLTELYTIEDLKEDAQHARLYPAT